MCSILGRWNCEFSRPQNNAGEASASNVLNKGESNGASTRHSSAPASAQAGREAGRQAG